LTHSKNHFGATRQTTSAVRNRSQERMRDQRARELTHLGVMLIKPGLKPVSGLFSRNLLPLLLAKFGAICQSLLSRGAAALVHEIATLRRAACDPPMIAAGMTSRMSSSVATSMSPTVASSSTRKYRRRRENKDCTDD